MSDNCPRARDEGGKGKERDSEGEEGRKAHGLKA